MVSKQSHSSQSRTRKLYGLRSWQSHLQSRPCFDLRTFSFYPAYKILVTQDLSGPHPCPGWSLNPFNKHRKERLGMKLLLDRPSSESKDLLSIILHHHTHDIGPFKACSKISTERWHYFLPILKRNNGIKLQEKWFADPNKFWKSIESSHEMIEIICVVLNRAYPHSIFFF